MEVKKETTRATANGTIGLVSTPLTGKNMAVSFGEEGSSTIKKLCTNRHDYDIIHVNNINGARIMSSRIPSACQVSELLLQSKAKPQMKGQIIRSWYA